MARGRAAGDYGDSEDPYTPDDAAGMPPKPTTPPQEGHIWVFNGTEWVQIPDPNHQGPEDTDDDPPTDTDDDPPPGPTDTGPGQPNDPNRPSDRNLPPGYVWKYVDGRWVQHWTGDKADPGTKPDGTPNGTTPSGGDFDAGANGGGGWPEFKAPPRVDPGPFVPRRNTFDYADYFSPTIEQAEQEPGYAFAKREAGKQVEASAAARGMLRSGKTLKDLYAFGDQFSQQNYKTVDDRMFRNYSTNRGNAFEKFATEYGVDRDVWDRGAAEADRASNYGFNAAQAEFAPRFEGAKLDFADLYNRWKTKVDSLTNIASATANI